MNEKEKLVDYINRSQAIIADTNTYIWLRSVNPKILNDIPELGGGNLLMALGLFAVINYLGKIYTILKGGIPVTKDQADAANQWLKDKNIKDSGFEKIIETKRFGQLNETEAFKTLLNDCPGLNLGLSPEELKGVWHNIRNKLTHVVSPGKDYQINARLGGGTYEKAKKEAFNFNRVFYIDGSVRVHCNVDVLGIKVEKIKEWIIEQLNSNTFEEDNINRALRWVQENE